MTRYEQGFMDKCAEYGVDGSIFLEKKAGFWKTLALLAAAGGLGYLGSRIFNTDLVGGKQSGIEQGLLSNDGSSVSNAIAGGISGKNGVDNAATTGSSYFNPNINYTRRRHMMADLIGAIKGAKGGLIKGVPIITALGIMSRGRGLRAITGALRNIRNPRNLSRYGQYGSRLFKKSLRNALIAAPIGGAALGAADADMNARLRMWEGQDPRLDTVAVGRA